MLQKRDAKLESMAANELENLKLELKQLTLEALVDVKKAAASACRSSSTRDRSNTVALEEKVAAMGSQVEMLRKQAGASRFADDAQSSGPTKANGSLGGEVAALKRQVEILQKRGAKFESMA